MAKVKVIKSFRDKCDFSKVYAVGEECDFDDARAARMVELGLAEAASAAKKAAKAKASASAKDGTETTEKAE